MNEQTKLEIEKSADDLFDEDGQASFRWHSGYIQGATFGYDLALSHAKVLREALIMILKSEALKEAPMYNYCESILNIPEALSQFDKLTGDE